MIFVRRLACAAALLAFSVAPGRAGLQVIGDGITGDVAVANGTSLWSLIENVQTPVASGYNSKNAILHDYVVATSVDGAQSVFSAGELDPSFGGTNAAPYISVSGGDYTLVDPNAGASGRDLANLTSLTVVAAPALPTGPGGPSSSVDLSGKVTNPGDYTLTDLETGFAAVEETVSGDAYTGVPLQTFLAPSGVSATDGVVVVGATDGYEVVFSLAEIDPSLGGNPQNLLPYADTGGNFPGDGVARVIFPDDNKHGRWVSNIDFIDVGVAAVPEAPVWTMMLIGFAGLGLAALAPAAGSGRPDERVRRRDGRARARPPKRAGRRRRRASPERGAVPCLRVAHALLPASRKIPLRSRPRRPRPHGQTRGAAGVRPEALSARQARTAQARRKAVAAGAHAPVRS